MRIVMLSKKNLHADRAYEFLKKAFKTVERYSSNERYRKFPKDLLSIEGDVLISFLSPWIVPKSVIKNFKVAINFHPGPPEYPGAGCYNFALYYFADEYGVTAHFMSEQVDSGKIIKVKRFPIYDWDNVQTLRERTMDYLLILFYEIVDSLIQGKELRPSNEKWKRKPYKSRDIEKLCEISPFMDETEIRRRIKATYYPGMPGPYIKIAGMIFEYTPEREKVK